MYKSIHVQISALIVIILSFETKPVHGDILTDPNQLSATNSIIDFESLVPGSASNPLVIGDATFSSTEHLSVWDISFFPANGTYVLGNTLRATDSAGYADLRIDFAVPIGEIGLGWFDPNFFGNRLEVYDASGSLLEFADIPSGPFGGISAAFRGIRRSQNDISYAIAKVSTSGDVYSIDNISFGTVAVPEPGAALGLICLCGIGAFLRRRPSRSH